MSAGSEKMTTKIDSKSLEKPARHGYKPLNVVCTVHISNLGKLTMNGTTMNLGMNGIMTTTMPSKDMWVKRVKISLEKNRK